MTTLTSDQAASRIVNADEAAAVAYVNERADRLYFASINRGTYGRLMLPLIKRHWPYVNLNGCSTSIGLAITQELEARGYGFKYENGAVTFERATEGA